MVPRIFLLLMALCVAPQAAFTAQLRTLEVNISFDASTTTKTVAGFNLYEDSILVCKTNDPKATTISCGFVTEDGTHSYELAARYSDGTESQKSPRFQFTISTTTGTLAAAITANPTSGTAPLPVSFNGTSSTGSITSYRWNFGDGTTGTGATTSHTYSTAGSYTASLQISDSTGASATSSKLIQVGQSTTQPTAPKAVITSSTAAGAAPLTVLFDGSSSTATNATIVGYAWDFGDGAKGSGKTTSHTYSAAGTFSTRLVVTDSLSLTGSASTPIVVSQPTTTNQAPSASFTATPTQGSTPLTVSFDGSSSKDTDGTIASYAWNFGDGTTGSSKTVQHIYTNPATYTATLQVKDDKGATSASASKSISAQAAQKLALNYEVGELKINSNWARVNFKRSFTKPVVIVSPPTYIDTQPALIRVRNLSSTGFEVRLQEWDYMDGSHPYETVNYLALEQGRTILPNGSIIEAGIFNGSTVKSTKAFSAAFKVKPVVFTTITSVNQPYAIAGRVSGVTTKGFSYMFREQELSTRKHVAEAVTYVAWSTGSGSVDNIKFAAALPTRLVTKSLTNVTFPVAFPAKPFFFVEMQTMNEVDPAALRIYDLVTTKAVLTVQEEESKDSETSHIGENVGYLGITAN